ncbi:hypothetical protein BLOT_008777 [Blomia tropicalis]|nr:hypothetical protein BLOT_008777 [Blomia tropicalis]
MNIRSVLNINKHLFETKLSKQFKKKIKEKDKLLEIMDYITINILNNKLFEMTENNSNNMILLKLKVYKQNEKCINHVC